MGSRAPTGKHPFDQLCQAHGCEDRLIRPRQPQTNGLVERFNGRYPRGVGHHALIECAKPLDQTLQRYAALYNRSHPQKALGHITPMEALKNWYAKRPDLFQKRVYNQTGSETREGTAGTLTTCPREN